MANKTCPVIPYGIPEGGAPEYNVNSGRELFRCGIGQNGCIKLYITNVSVDKSIVNYGCKTSQNANQGKFCLENVTYNERVNKQVQWIAKKGVDSSLPNGTVITRVGECDGGNGVIPLYTEATVRARSMLNINDLDTNMAKQIVQTALENLSKHLDGDWILQDIGTSVSPTSWQTANVTFMLLSNEIPEYDTYRETINLTNGRVQTSTGHVIYDDTETPQDLATIIETLLKKA
jgi:hypothetical protein